MYEVLRLTKRSIGDTHYSGSNLLGS